MQVVNLGGEPSKGGRDNKGYVIELIIAMNKQVSISQRTRTL